MSSCYLEGMDAADRPCEPGGCPWSGEEACELGRYPWSGVRACELGRWLPMASWCLSACGCFSLHFKHWEEADNDLVLSSVAPSFKWIEVF